MTSVKFTILALAKKIWPKVTAYALLGVLSALAAVIFNGYLPEEFGKFVGTETAGNILTILASSMLAVTTFSLSTMVSAYGAATSNVTPRATSLITEDKTTQNALSTFLGLFRSIPPLAWVPLVLAWFGMLSLADVFSVPIGPAYPYFHNIKLSMIFIIFIGGFYPVLTSAIHGVGLVPQTLTDAARVLGANQVDIFRKVLLPYAAPSIINGLRIGLGVSWMCLVSAEMLPGSLSGVGYLITHAYTVGRTDVVIAGMISIGLVGAVLDRIFRLYEDRKFVWKRLTK